MLAFESGFCCKSIWRIRHTEEMRSIFEVGSEQLPAILIFKGENSSSHLRKSVVTRVTIKSVWIWSGKNLYITFMKTQIKIGIPYTMKIEETEGVQQNFLKTGNIKKIRLKFNKNDETGSLKTD